MLILSQFTAVLCLSCHTSLLHCSSVFILSQFTAVLCLSCHSSLQFCVYPVTVHCSSVFILSQFTAVLCLSCHSSLQFCVYPVTLHCSSVFILSHFTTVLCLSCHSSLLSLQFCVYPVSSVYGSFSSLAGFVCWLLNVPATCECISGTDLLRYVCHTEIEPGIFRSRGGRLNHKANEAVLWLGRIASSLNRAGGGGGGGGGRVYEQRRTGIIFGSKVLWTDSECQKQTTNCLIYSLSK